MAGSCFVTPPNSPGPVVTGGQPPDWNTFLFLSKNVRVRLLGEIIQQRKNEIPEVDNCRFKNGEQVLVFYNAPKPGYYFVAKIGAYLNLVPDGEGVPRHTYDVIWEEQGWGRTSNHEITFSVDIMRLEGMVSPLELLYAHYWNAHSLTRSRKTFEDRDLTAKGIFHLTQSELVALEAEFEAGIINTPVQGKTFQQFAGM